MRAIGECTGNCPHPGVTAAASTVWQSLPATESIPTGEAPALYFLTQGLIGPILIGLYRPDEALALVDAQLDRVFRSAAP